MFYIEIEIKKYICVHKNLRGLENLLALTIWDAGGEPSHLQNIYRAIIQKQLSFAEHTSKISIIHGTRATELNN